MLSSLWTWFVEMPLVTFLLLIGIPLLLSLLHDHFFGDKR